MVAGGWNCSQLTLGEQQGTPWTSCQTNHHSHLHSHLQAFRVHLAWPINLTCMSLDWSRSTRRQSVQALGEHANLSQRGHAKEPSAFYLQTHGPILYINARRTTLKLPAFYSLHSSHSPSLQDKSLLKQRTWGNPTSYQDWLFRLTNQWSAVFNSSFFSIGLVCRYLSRRITQRQVSMDRFFWYYSRHLIMETQK